MKYIRCQALRSYHVKRFLQSAGSPICAPPIPDPSSLFRGEGRGVGPPPDKFSGPLVPRLQTKKEDCQPVPHARMLPAIDAPAGVTVNAETRRRLDNGSSPAFSLNLLSPALRF